MSEANQRASTLPFITQKSPQGGSDPSPASVDNSSIQSEEEEGDESAP
jgi:hypothetical protein